MSEQNREIDQQAPEPQHSGRKWLLLAAKLAVIALVVWAVRATLASALRDLADYRWEIHPLLLSAAGVLYLAGLMPAAWFWHRLLASTGQHLAFWPAVRAYYISQIGKYVPGKAMVLILRTSLVRAARLDTALVVASIFLETLSAMATGSLLALIVIAIAYPKQMVTAHLWSHTELSVPLVVVAAGLFAATALPTLPPVLRMIVRLLGMGRVRPEALEQLESAGYGVLAAGWGALAVGWVLQALAMWAVVRGVGAASDLWSDLPLHLAAVALAVVAGFLALLPGGLGVREVVLVPLLAPRYGPGTALVCAVMLRLVTLVAEVIVCVILYASTLIDNKRSHV